MPLHSSIDHYINQALTRKSNEASRSASKALAQIAAIPDLVPEHEARRMSNAEYIAAYLHRAAVAKARGEQ